MLRRRLRLTTDVHYSDRSSQQQQWWWQQQRDRRLLGGMLPDGLPEVQHPCLHGGYRQVYKRLQQEGAALPSPAQVVLVGR